MKTCKCGCGQPLPEPARKRNGRKQAEFIKGHNFNVTTLDDRHCETCGIPYHPRYKYQRFCSVECYEPTRSSGRIDRVSLTCAVCGSSYEVAAHRKETSRFCSKQCWSNRAISVKKKCVGCNHEFSTTDKRQKFCSKDCFSKYNSGENHPMWKDGKAARTKRGKISNALRKWREQVYKRDNYTCQKCGKHGGELHAHHQKSLADFPDLATNVGNGITLCISCHEGIHGRKLRTPGKYPKHCVDCGATTTGRSQRCRSCSTAHSWKTKRNH